jgi:hypothetical protein
LIYYYSKDFIFYNQHTNGRPQINIQLSADTVSGTSPLETTLHVDSSFDIASSRISYQGPGEAEFLERTIDEFQVKLTTVGVYTFGIEVKDQHGHTHTDEETVEVVDAAVLNALLQAKWMGMKAALMAGDIQNAVKYFVSNRQNAYSLVFNDLSDKIGEKISATGELEAFEESDNEARYIQPPEAMSFLFKAPTGCSNYSFFKY